MPNNGKDIEFDNPEIIYVVTNDDYHEYPWGIFTTKEKAKRAIEENIIIYQLKHYKIIPRYLNKPGGNHITHCIVPNCERPVNTDACDEHAKSRYVSALKPHTCPE
jgi:hypothetical protein